MMLYEVGGFRPKGGEFKQHSWGGLGWHYHTEATVAGLLSFGSLRKSIGRETFWYTANASQSYGFDGGTTWARRLMKERSRSLNKTINQHRWRLHTFTIKLQPPSKRTSTLPESVISARATKQQRSDTTLLHVQSHISSLWCGFRLSSRHTFSHHC